MRQKKSKRARKVARTSQSFSMPPAAAALVAQASLVLEEFSQSEKDRIDALVERVMPTGFGGAAGVAVRMFMGARLAVSAAAYSDLSTFLMSLESLNEEELFDALSVTQPGNGCPVDAINEGKPFSEYTDEDREQIDSLLREKGLFVE